MDNDGLEPTNQSFIARFLQRHPPCVLEMLLRDRTTGKNIIWADNEYEAYGPGFMGEDEITPDKVTGDYADLIKPRVEKALESRSKRTKTRAEVFSPSWLCNRMNNDLDEGWFGRRDAFTLEGDQAWEASPAPVAFPQVDQRDWRSYVEAPWLEITCGEAPFVCSRYDTVTGAPIPVHARVGFLDRKLRVVSERVVSREEWLELAMAALQSCYGFEYQGDNLLVARINVLETFCDHMQERWRTWPTPEEIGRAAEVVSWNFWQMNGFTYAVPTNKMEAEVCSTLEGSMAFEAEPEQLSLFDLDDELQSDETNPEAGTSAPRETVPLCIVYSWKDDRPFEFASLRRKGCLMGKKFYAVIGNPPYQAEGAGNKTFAPPSTTSLWTRPLLLQKRSS